MLLAGMAFYLRAGNLGIFAPTFMFHMVEGIRTVNTWLVDSKTYANAMCLRLVATLCYIEARIHPSLADTVAMLNI